MIHKLRSRIKESFDHTFLLSFPCYVFHSIDCMMRKKFPNLWLMIYWVLIIFTFALFRPQGTRIYRLTS